MGVVLARAGRQRVAQVGDGIAIHALGCNGEAEDPAQLFPKPVGLLNVVSLYQPGEQGA